MAPLFLMDMFHRNIREIAVKTVGMCHVQKEDAHLTCTSDHTTMASHQC